MVHDWASCAPRSLIVIFDHAVQLYATCLLSFMVQVGKAHENVLADVSVSDSLIERGPP